MVALVVGALLIAPGSGAATLVKLNSDAQISGLVATVASPPRWFTGSDGFIHLVYELWLTNPLPVDVTVQSVESLDAAAGGTLMRLEGEMLLEAMSMASDYLTPTVVLPPSSVGVVWFDVPLAAGMEVPARLAHRLEIAIPPGFAVPESFLAFTGAVVDVDRRLPVVLGPPLAGPRWAALGSCCDGPHRRALYPIDGQWFLAQRFAIDFNLLEEGNLPGIGDPTRYTSFSTYGQPVLAVADAVVVEATDGHPDFNIGEAYDELTVQNAGGNRVILDLGDGRFAIYSHLQAGSISVHPGDAVKRGERIAAVGSSGTTGGPHLHFQVTDAPSVVVADGLPYVFDAFDVTGRTPPLAEVIPYYDTFEPIPLTGEGAGPRENVLPLGRDVVTFPPVE